MSDITLSEDEYEDERLIKLSQVKREYIVNTLMDPVTSNKGIPKDEGSRIILMQAIDGLSSVALKRQSMRQKAKADKEGNEAFKSLASEIIKGMVGSSAHGSRAKPVEFKESHKQTYVEGELSTDPKVVDEQDIVKARENLINKKS